MADAVILWHRDGNVFVKLGPRAWQLVGTEAEFDSLPAPIDKVRLARQRMQGPDRFDRVAWLPQRRHRQ